MQLLTVKNIDLDGMQRPYQRGDWVNVGKQTALRWIAANEARVVSNVTIDTPPDSGLVLSAEQVPEDALARYGLSHLPRTVSASPTIAYEKVVWWDVTAKARVDLFPAGLGFMERWSVAAPLWSYDVLARDMGDDEDKAATEAVIGDLRVPLYDVRLLFLRRNAEAQRLLDLWAEEKGERMLAFLRAVWKVKPLILALPTDWVKT